MQRPRDLLPERGGVFNQGWIVFVFASCLLEGGLPSDHVEEDDTDGENVSLTRLVWQLEVDLGAHIVDSSDESLRILVEVGGEHEISNLQIEVVVSVDVKILRLEIPVGKTFVLNRLQSIDELLEVVAGDRLWQSTSLR